MLIGALIAGTITDLVGRRKIILFCIAWFSLAMGLCAIAPSPELFGFFRFLAGLGLGGVVPDGERDHDRVRAARSGASSSTR